MMLPAPPQIYIQMVWEGLRVVFTFHTSSPQNTHSAAAYSNNPPKAHNNFHVIYYVKVFGKRLYYEHKKPARQNARFLDVFIADLFDLGFSVKFFLKI